MNTYERPADPSASLRTRSGVSPARRLPTSTGTIAFAAAHEALTTFGTPRPVDLVSESELSRLFHRLNNQLGVILANAELLESRLSDETQRARASQIVAGAVDAIASVQGLRRLLTPENERNPGLTPSAS